MAKFDYKNMTEGAKKRFDALSEYDQQAVEAIVEVWDYSLEEALDIVERGDYEFHPGHRCRGYNTSTCLWRSQRDSNPRHPD